MILLYIFILLLYRAARNKSRAERPIEGMGPLDKKPCALKQGHTVGIREVGISIF